MAAEDESIGGIRVDIVGDYSKLQSDIDTAASIAAAGGAEIASALNTGAAGADALSSAVSAAALGMGSFEAQIQALVDTGSTLAEALAAVGDGTAAVATGVEEAGAAAAAAAEQMSLFDQSIDVPYADAAGQLNLFATELEPIPAAAQAAAKATEDFGQAEEEVAEHSHHAAGALGELGEKMVAFGEALVIVEGLHELGAEALAASDNITRASISLTALTGSGEKAKGIIEEIEKLGIKDGLSLPSLLQASTRMTNLLGASAPVPELLAKIADGAAVMGTDIGRAADSFDRLVTAGTLGARQLTPIGLSLEKVSAAMNEISGSSNATAENVKKLFTAMDQTQRIEVLSKALEHLGGIAEETAEKTFGGQWQILSNQWEQIMRNVGDALMPVITSLTNLMKVDVLPFVKDITDAFNQLPAPVRESAVVVAILAAAIVPVTLAIGGLGLALSAAGSAIAPVVASIVSLGGAMAGAGASYTAMLATGIATVGLWVALAAELATVAVAYHTMAKAEDLAAQSQADAAKSLAVYETALRQHGIDISAVQTQYAQGLITYDQYKKALDGLRDSYLQTHPVLQQHAAATTAAFNADESARIKMQALGEAVDSTRKKLAEVTAAYDAHKASAQDVAKAYDAWQSATGALKSAQEALLPVVSNLHVATKQWVDNIAALPAAATAAADASEALNVKIAAESMALLEAQRGLDGVLQRYHDHNASAQDVAKALDLVNAKQGELNRTMGQLPTINLQPTVAQLTAAGKAITDLLPPLSRVPPGVRDVTSILQDMGVKIDDVHNIFQNKLLKDYDELQTKTHTLDEENAAWEKISGSLGKIGKVDLPLMLSLYDKHLAQLQKDGAAEGVILEWKEKQLQAAIQLDEQSGKSATSEIVAMKGLELRQKALIDNTRLWGDTITAVADDAIKGFVGMGASMAQVIVEGGNMGKVFVDTAKKIAEAILTDIIKAGLQKIVDMIVLNVVPAIGSQVAPIATTTAAIHAMQVAMATATASMTADIQALNAQFAALSATIGGTSGAGAATGAAGAGSKATGGMGALGTAGAVGSIVGAISSIFGNFQNERMISTLGHIEENTRRMDIVFERFAQTDEWDRQTNLFAKLDDMWNALRDIGTAVVTGAQGIVDTLTSLASGASASPASLPRVPGLPSVGVPSSATYASSSTTNSNASIGTVNFIVSGASDPRAVVRSVADSLKILSPKFSAFGS